MSTVIVISCNLLIIAPKKIHAYLTLTSYDMN